MGLGKEHLDLHSTEAIRYMWLMSIWNTASPNCDVWNAHIPIILLQQLSDIHPPILVLSLLPPLTPNYFEASWWLYIISVSFLHFSLKGLAVITHKVVIFQNPSFLLTFQGPKTNSQRESLSDSFYVIEVGKRWLSLELLIIRLLLLPKTFLLRSGEENRSLVREVSHELLFTHCISQNHW